MEENFFYCDSCGNLALMLIASGVTPECCGDEMTCLNAQSADEGREKHVPVVSVSADHELTVTVGSTPHPMVANHFIEFVCLQTTDSFVIHQLKAGEEPKAVLRFSGKPVAVFAYCNIHGLWRADISNMCQGKTGCTEITKKQDILN